ncbi:MAG TPA: hypothetical protein PLI43_17885 [Albidovulum sp.]|uniref:hypothetical protein n=1 Tax=Albidovulum sp. TaxID=1872424 RepID=UPI002CCC4605|nr:hypothetical protein [Albidovulum sp.]
MASAGVVICMGQRQIGRYAKGIAVKRLIEDKVEKVLQLDLAEGQNVRHAGPGNCAGNSASVSCQDSDFECAVEVGGRSLDGFSLAQTGGKPV